VVEAVDTSVDASGRLSHRQIMIVLSGLLLGMLLAAMDQTIVSAAMKTIADKLNSQTNQAWAVTSYLVTSTVSTPLYGKLGDMYGRRKLYLFAISIFLVGSALCGLSQSMLELAAFRAVQGIGAGGLMSLALAIVGDIVPPRERARYQGFFMSVFGVSSIAGPVVGGVLAGQSQLLGVDGWRWVFYVNLPLGIFAYGVVSRKLKLPHYRLDHRVDYRGAVALVLGVTALLIVAEQGRIWGWASSRSILFYVLGIGLLIAFGAIERAMGDEAILPLRLFRNPVFSVASAMNFIIGAGMFGGIVCLPLYMQIAKGFSPITAGLSLLPMMSGVILVTMISSTFTARTGRYRIFPIIGSGVLMIGFALLSRIDADTSYSVLAMVMLLVGGGLGCCIQALVLATQNAVPPSEMGVATSAATFFRSMGGTFATALFLTVFFSGASSKIESNMNEAVKAPDFQAALSDPANAAFAKVLAAMRTGGIGEHLNNTEFLRHLPKVLSDPFLIGFSGSMGRVFLLAAIVVAPAFMLSFTLKEVTLQTESGLQAQASARAEQEAAGTIAERIPSERVVSGDWRVG
jgi:EmrB/QacA subfamily drug resistance transporter